MGICFRSHSSCSSRMSIDAEAEGRELDDMQGELALEDVSFCYPSRPDAPIFSKFSLTIPAGATVALVGQRGSGKSTVIQLVQRFYDPLAGEQHRLLRDQPDLLP